MAEQRTTKAAHQEGWRTFEVVFGIPLVAAIALQWLFPLSLPSPFLTLPVVVAGIALIVIGVGIVVVARGEFTRHGQPTDPGRATNRLMTEGIFAYSRNPLYLGGVCLLLGIALALHMAWMLIMLIPALILCHFVLIAPEERYLAATFGDDYRAYANKVFRWIGRNPFSR